MKPIILSEKDIAKKMPELPGWEYKDKKLRKSFEFETFMDGLNFVNDLALYFEEVDHHADMHIFYTKIIFELQRADVGGKVTDLDFEVAKGIEARYRAFVA